MTTQLLAEAAGGISPETVGIIIGSVILALISGGVLGKKVSDSSKTTIDPQPLMVRMQEDFVPRREFDKLETLVAVNAAKAEGYLKQSTDQMERAVAGMAKTMERSNERLSRKIEEVASGAYEARRRIHENVNDLSREQAKLAERADIAGELKEVSDKIVEAVKAISKPSRS